MAGEVTLGYDGFPAQAAFHRSKARHKAFIGGYGSGKTHAACWEAIYLSARNQGCVGALVSPSYPMMRDTIWRSFEDILQENQIAYTTRRSEWKVFLPWFNAEVWFRSADDPTKLKGPNLAWIGLDEAASMDEEAWKVALSRVRDPNAGHPCIFITTTPEGFNWVYDVFEKENRDNYELFRSSTFENVEVPDAFALSLEKDYDDAHQAAYIRGEFVDLYTGRVYSAFDRKLHIREFDLDPVLPLMHAVDFNVDPNCSVIGFESNGTFYIWDEIVIEGGADTTMMCMEFNRRIGDLPNRIMVTGDSSGAARSTKAAVSDYHIIRENYRRMFLDQFLGVDVPRSNPRVPDRVNAVQAALRKGSIVVHPRCTNLIEDLARVAWKDGTRDIDKSNRKLSHLSDALGYWVARVAPIRSTSSRRRARDFMEKSGQSRFAGVTL